MWSCSPLKFMRLRLKTASWAGSKEQSTGRFKVQSELGRLILTSQSNHIVISGTVEELVKVGELDAQREALVGSVVFETLFGEV